LPASRYRFLPHTTDAYIEAFGPTLEEALENAGLALFDTMCDVNAITAELREEVTVQGADQLELLYNWLESLLLKFELEHRVYNSFKVSLVSDQEGLGLQAKLQGETFDPKRHGAKVEVKAVTYHKMEISQEGNKVVVRFIVDL
jgi:SHS2 domain-containing protein